MEARIPASILKLDAVSREINFCAREEIRNLKLKQQVLFHGSPIEEWSFDFGFVIPNSSNCWQQVILASDKQPMMDAQALDGNVVVHTEFLDGAESIGNLDVRVFYEEKPDEKGERI